jgi:hypothetical protein
MEAGVVLLNCSKANLAFLEYREKTPPQKEMYLESLKLEVDQPYQCGSEERQS